MTRKRQTPPNYAKKSMDELLWGKLKRRSAYKSEYRNNYEELIKSRSTYQSRKKRLFKATFRCKRRRGTKFLINHRINQLTYWCKLNLWTYCRDCGPLYVKPLTPKSLNQRGLKTNGKRSCHCGKKKYSIPTYTKIPKELCALTADDESLLSIFDVDNDLYTTLKFQLLNSD